MAKGEKTRRASSHLNATIAKAEPLAVEISAA
jgi:hypothetical protein